MKLVKNGYLLLDNELKQEEMLFDETTGKIKAMLVPAFHSKGRFSANSDIMQLPWDSIVKIGEDIIIFRS